MKIRQKLLWGALALSWLPLLLSAWWLWQGAVALTERTVTAQMETHLQSLRDLKAQQVREEVESRLASVRALAQNRATLEAMQHLRDGFHRTAHDLPQFRRDMEVLHRQMQTYIEQGFGPEFQRRNAGMVPRLKTALSTRSADATLLQHIYIAANPFPLGQKERLMALAEPRFGYGDAHARHHPSLERAQKLLGFYDIFLIDTNTDEVIYTVFKELDFGSRLSDGIAANSKLAEAYAKVKNAKSPQDIYLSDFEPYGPSYNDQAAFVAVPLFEGERQIGVLAVQYPIDKINAAMSSGHAWTQIGLGQTGDVLLVGPDELMRSNARAMVDDAQRSAYLEQLEGRLEAPRWALLKAKHSTIGLVRWSSEATRAALTRHERGVAVQEGLLGRPVVVAYAPLELAGQSWAILAHMDLEEANAPQQALDLDLGARTLGIAACVLLAVGGAMVWVRRRITQPVEQVRATVQAVTAGQWSARCRLAGDDELASLGQAVDQMLDERVGSLLLAVRDNEQLTQSAQALQQTVKRLSARDLTVRAIVSEDVMGALATSINQFSDAMGSTLGEVRGIAEQMLGTAESVERQTGRLGESVQSEHTALGHMTASLHQTTEHLRQVARLSETSNQAAEQATHATDAALRSVAATVQGMEQLRAAMSETEVRFKRLGERSQDISTVVTLIGTLAERTHTLAINATMQAATAGEAGRGFTVVAEEVQRLSESSRQAAQQITQLVHNLQAETRETVHLMNRLIAQMVGQLAQAQQAGGQMDQTRHATIQLVQWVQQIASFSEQQTQLAHALQEVVDQLDQGSGQTRQALERQRGDTAVLARAARRLAETVASFRLPLA